ncbi:hypothetical protein A6A40_05575 [Azospirillum humicireducens]|uniref:Uncharacterized protein n=1 Tax=Azospirillum humicireducens TaxID=1226968 RepID=A0A160JF43_9PROT|nr:hypothetical protein A6A40_05575 [Azospirillum humicireducens]
MKQVSRHCSLFHPATMQSREMPFADQQRQDIQRASMIENSHSFLSRLRLVDKSRTKILEQPWFQGIIPATAQSS